MLRLKVFEPSKELTDFYLSDHHIKADKLIQSLLNCWYKYSKKGFKMLNIVITNQDGTVLGKLEKITHLAFHSFMFWGSVMAVIQDSMDKDKVVNPVDYATFCEGD